MVLVEGALNMLTTVQRGPREGQLRRAFDHGKGADFAVNHSIAAKQAVMASVATEIGVTDRINVPEKVAQVGKILRDPELMEDYAQSFDTLWPAFNVLGITSLVNEIRPLFSSEPTSMQATSRAAKILLSTLAGEPAIPNIQPREAKIASRFFDLLVGYTGYANLVGSVPDYLSDAITTVFMVNRNNIKQTLHLLERTMAFSQFKDGGDPAVFLVGSAFALQLRMEQGQDQALTSIKGMTHAKKEGRAEQLMGEASTLSFESLETITDVLLSNDYVEEARQLPYDERMVTDQLPESIVRLYQINALSYIAMAGFLLGEQPGRMNEFRQFYRDVIIPAYRTLWPNMERSKMETVATKLQAETIRGRIVTGDSLGWVESDMQRPADRQVLTGNFGEDLTTMVRCLATTSRFLYYTLSPTEY